MEQTIISSQELHKLFNKVSSTIKRAYNRIFEMIRKSIIKAGITALNKRFEIQRDTATEFEKVLGENLRVAYNIKKVDNIPLRKEFDKLQAVNNKISRLEVIVIKTKKARTKKKIKQRIRKLENESIRLIAKYL